MAGVTSPWATPEPTAGPAFGPPPPWGAVEVRRGRPARWARALAVAVLVGGLATWPLYFFGIFTLVLAVFIVPLAAALAGLTVALGVVAAVLLVVAATQRAAGGWVATTAMLVVGAGLAGWLLDGLFLGPQRAYDEEQRRAAAAERVLPVDAPPVEVVAYAHRLADLPYRREDPLESSRVLCGLMGPRYRDGCQVSPGVSPLEPPAYEVVRDEGDRVVVAWTERPFDERVAVRLERSQRGWELVDVPTDGGNDCVPRALANGDEPWSCPPAR